MSIELDCQDFVEALDLASGCLQTTDMVEILTHICFDDRNFYAYDDKTATIVDLPTGLTCAVRGDKLIAMLKPIKGKVKLTQQQNQLEINSTNQRKSMFSIMAALPDESYVYEDPRYKGTPHIWIELTDEILNSLLTACESVSKNPMDIDWSGVNILTEEDEHLTICSCDNMTLVTIDLNANVNEVNGGISKRIIVPRSFIMQLKRVRTAIKSVEDKVERLLIIGNDHVAARFRTFIGRANYTGVKVVSKLIRSEKPTDFLEIREQYTTDSNDWSDMPTPKEDDWFGMSLRRALAVCAGDNDAALRLAVNGTVLTMSVDGASSQMIDEHKLLEAPGNASVTVDPEHVARYSDEALLFSIVDKRAMCFRRGSDYFIIGGKSTAKKKREGTEENR